MLANACCFAAGPYNVDNVLVEGTCVYTNNPPCGAMRGFGAVQGCFAHEAQMDKLAAALDIDPVELRLLNALKPGDTLPTGQLITGSLPVAEVIRRCAELDPPAPEELPREPVRLPGGTGNTTRGEGVRRGTGFAVGMKNICFSEGFDDYAAARVRLFSTATGALSAEVLCAAAEVGQGVTDVIAQVARQELGIDDVAVTTPSTTGVGSAGSSSASRMTWMAAGAVRLACQEALAERERTGADVDVERVYRHLPTFPLDPETGQVLGERAHVAFACAAMKVVAEVDVELGLTRIVWIGTAQDVGKALNPLAVHGQIEGGTAQGIGLALMEEIQTTGGLITNASFTDYLIPTALDVPPIDAVLVEEPEPDGPYGLKGVGEPPTVVSTAAVVSALARRDRPRAGSRARPAGRHRAMTDLARRIAVARGDEPADLVVKGGRVLSVFTREWLDTDVAVCDGYVAGLGDYEGTETLDVAARSSSPASSTPTCTSSRRSCSSTSSRGSCSRWARPPSSPTRTRSRTSSAATASTGCSTSARACRSTCTSPRRRACPRRRSSRRDAR